MATGRGSADAIVVDDDSDDLDIVATNQPSTPVNRNNQSYRPKGDRVTWSDDEDGNAAYSAFKKRKTEARKKARATVVHRKAKTTSMVGRKPKKTRAAAVYASDDAEDETLLLDDTLPEHVRARRRSWSAQREKLGTAGLLLPPNYEDVDFSEDERLEQLHEKPRLPRVKPPRPYEDVGLQHSAGVIPAPIAQYLKPYQVDGTAWLHERFVHQKGGILGDDMGLGKTIQVIAFLTAAFGKTGDERDARRMRKMRVLGDQRWYPRILIVCPGTLMQNWRNELDRWGWWHVYVCHGESKEDAFSAAAKGSLEIMLTTYATYRLNEGTINDIPWDCVIADECHTIKDPSTDITKAMNNVNALCRIGLSGTAIQNKYEELWTLLNWTSPGALGPLSVWKDSICVPLKVGQSHDATIPQLSKARRVAEKLVKNLLPRFFLRRTKALIADQLPKKSDRVVFCPLTETQSQAYDNFCDHELVRCIRDAAEPCPCLSGKKQGWCCYAVVDGFGRWHQFVFPCLMTLQKLANHVALTIPSEEADKEKHHKDIQKLEIAFPDRWEELYRMRDSILTLANQEFCGKWRVLKKLLRLWHDNGDKVLVFSYSVRLLRMLQLLFSTTTSYNVSYLDGSMSLADRQQAVDEYNSDPGQFVFLISTKAGGVGLNITSANKVVVVDPNWNPSFDLQAQDRAYRIGQTRDVEVFRLVSVGTVEEIVYARQIYKQQQANIGYNASVERRYFTGVQDMKNQKGEIFGLRNLFAPPQANVVLRDIVNKTNIAETKAGVEIAGLDLEACEDEEDDLSGVLLDSTEDAAMSDLAAEIIDAASARRQTAKKVAKKKDPVQAILASAGVEYTHENAEVIGTSKVETRISNRAQRAGEDVNYMNELAFLKSNSQTDNADDHAEPSDTPAESIKIKYQYRPPEDVRVRQFCTMAKHFGYDDVTEFALLVEGWTQQQRRDCLDRFYQDRRAVLASM